MPSIPIGPVMLVSRASLIGFFFASCFAGNRAFNNRRKTGGRGMQCTRAHTTWFITFTLFFIYILVIWVVGKNKNHLLHEDLHMGMNL